MLICYLIFFYILGKLTSQATVADILDKGSGALILLDGNSLGFCDG